MYLQIFLQLVLPGFLLVSLWRSRHASRWDWFLNLIIISLTLLFLFLTARWDFVSYYLRIALLPGLILAGYVSFRRIIPSRDSLSERPNPVQFGTSILFIVLLAALNISVLGGLMYPGQAIDLSYPLRGGMYYVGGGGNSRWINNHNAFPPQDYALDILRLNRIGNRANSLSPASLDAYAIYGDDIYSPCTGTILQAVDGHSDQTPPQRDSVNLAGNYVLVACQDVAVLLAHMQQGSVSVSADQKVDTGTVLGRVGNSGNSSQPHLHIHAERGGDPDEILDGRGVPITFQGRFLIRNSVFTGR